MKSKPVGVVITSVYNLENNFPWHPSLQRISENLTSIEGSVLECAFAGCSSIWICCDELMQPLVRERLGDFVRDPVNLNKSNYTKFPRDNRVMIPLYYYCVHPKDKLRRSGVAWDFMNTVLAVYHFSNKLSRWLVPKKYYISFCYGLYDIETIKYHRLNLLEDDNYLITYREGDIFDNLYLGACLKSDYIKQTIISLKKDNKYFKTPGLQFKNIPRPREYKKIEVNDYFSCNSWENYVEYIKNERLELNYSRDVFFNLKSSGVKF